MKKTLLAGLLFLLTIGLAARAQTVYILKVKVQIANIRSEPDLNAQVVGQVKLGELFESSNKSESFYEISFTDKSGKLISGFIHSGVVEVIKGGEPQKEEKPPVREEPPPVAVEPVRAQTAPLPARQPKRFILRGGMALTNVTISEALPAGVTKKSRMGFGGMIAYEFGGPKICMEIGAMYAPGGVEINSSYQGTPVRVISYGTGIGASLLAKIKFLQGTTPYLLVGGDVGYILSQKTEVRAGGQTQTTDNLNEINRLAYGLDFGGGFEFDMQGLGFLVEAKYSLGLSNQIKEPEEGQYVRPNGISILVGIKL